MTILSDIFPKKKPVIGMVHPRPLPGSPLYDPDKLNMADIIAIAVQEAQQLEQAGALSTTVHGAQSSIPTLSQVEEFLAGCFPDNIQYFI